MKLIENIRLAFPDAHEYSNNHYVAFRKKFNFVSIWIKTNGIYIETKRPNNHSSIGENIPDSHRYTLNYRMVIHTEASLNLVMEAIEKSYSMTR
jgi:predicted transport protein